MTNPALIATAAAASASRAAQQRHLDAFRLADATAPQRARTLADVGVTADAAFERLRGSGVLREGTPGTYYLDEAALIARRSAATPSRRVLLLVLVLNLLLGLALAVFIMSRRER